MVFQESCLASRARRVISQLRHHLGLGGLKEGTVFTTGMHGGCPLSGADVFRLSTLDLNLGDDCSQNQLFNDVHHLNQLFNDVHHLNQFDQPVRPHALDCEKGPRVVDQ